MLCCYSLIFNSEENAYLAVILFHLKAAASTAVWKKKFRSGLLRNLDAVEGIFYLSVLVLEPSTGVRCALFARSHAVWKINLALLVIKGNSILSTVSVG